MVNKLREFERSFVETAGILGPILAPIPSAVMILDSTHKHLDFHIIIAAIVAIVVELLGISTISNAMTIYEYNRTKRKSDERAPIAIAAVFVGFYFLSVFMLVIFLEITNGQQVFAKAFMPFLTVSGLGVMVMRKEHNERLERIEDEKENARIARKKRREEKKTVHPAVHKLSTGVHIDEHIVQTMNSGEHINMSTLAKQLDISRTTLYKRVNRLKEKGLIRTNGNIR